MSRSRMHVTVVVQTSCTTYFRLFSFCILFLEMNLEQRRAQVLRATANIYILIDRLGKWEKILMTPTVHGTVVLVCYAAAHMFINNKLY